MIEAALRTYRRGLLKTVAASTVFHALFIVALLILYKAGPGRVYYTPVTVSIVDESSLPGRHGRPAGRTAVSAPAHRAEPERVEAKKEAAAPEKTVKTSRVKASEAAKQHRLSPVDEALKRIAADVKAEDDSAAIRTSIERLKKKHEAEQKALSRGIDDIRQSLSRGSTVSAAAGPARPSATGGTGAAGGASASGASDVKYATYYNRISGIVQQEWVDYLGEFQDVSSEVIVSIRIARSGEVVDTRVERSSGNRRFDQSLLNAVKKASPFPALPKDFEGGHMDVSFRFCPECERKR